jgi:hypothetical protein
MRLEDLDTVRNLRMVLEEADATLKAFDAAETENVPVRAYTCATHGSLSFAVNLLPVPKQVAVSAARREREKIADKLRSLGVTVA